MKANNSTKPPSIRRLQSRAAKSAIRRVTDIYNAERAEAELNQIADPVQREQRASALRQEPEMEIKQLADRLTDLVPTDLSWDESESDLRLEQYQAVNNLGSLKQKYKLPSIETGSPALKKLFDDYRSPSNTVGESYKIDYLNPMGAQDLSADDEFLIEWLRKNQGFKPGKGKHPDDGENLIETILV
jgi:Skp family chaperone for outer membrane proteins